MRTPRTSIRKKLILAIMLTSTIVLVLTGITLTVFDSISSRNVLAQTLVTRARIIASNSTAALAFQNPEDAAQVLAALGNDPTTIAAALYGADGRRFASYPPSPPTGVLPSTLEPDGHRFRADRVMVFDAVVMDRRRLGTIVLCNSLKPLNDRLWLHLIAGLAAVIGSVLVAFALSVRLQRSIAHPVLALTAAVRNVSEHKDYAVRAEVVSDDEIGVLAGSFNDMLSRIEQHEYDHRRSAEQIRRLNVGLERSVAERTAELETSNRELEAFSYTVSHDLRAPLRAIDGFSKAVLEDCGAQLDDRGRRYLDRVRASVRTMSALIDDLLNLARLSRADLKRESVDLAAISREITDSLRQSDPAREAKIVIGEKLTTEGDSHLLRVVFDNLLRNAWKFTSKHPSATIEVGSRPEGSRSVYYVRDDGAGFDMEHAAILFKPFQRLHRQSEFEGTGVGLATVQRIIERHRGRLWAESAVERGATFYFTLWEKEAA